MKTKIHMTSDMKDCQILSAMVPKIIMVVDMAFIVDGNGGEELVQEMHWHLSICGAYVRFENNEFAIGILGSERLEGTLREFIPLSLTPLMSFG